MKKAKVKAKRKAVKKTKTVAKAKVLSAVRKVKSKHVPSHARA